MDALCDAALSGGSAAFLVFELGAVHCVATERWSTSLNAGNFAEMVDAFLDADASTRFSDSRTRNHCTKLSTLTPKFFHHLTPVLHVSRPPADEDIITASSPQEVRALIPACESGDLAAVRSVLADFSNQHPNDNLDFLTHGVSAAIRRERPGILLYSVERFDDIFALTLLGT